MQNRKRAIMVEFLEKHRACAPGLNWAKANCKTLQEVWDTCPKGEWLVWLAMIQGVLDETVLRRFACFCARQVWHLLTDDGYKKAIETAEAFCDGKATRRDLNLAFDGVWDAFRRSSKRWDASYEMTKFLLTIEARVAARKVSWFSAEIIAKATMKEEQEVGVQKLVSIEDAARDVQADWLRKNTKPNLNSNK